MHLLLGQKIIVRITGGLGNQMFQYSIGRAISIKNKIPLWLDISFYNNDKKYNRRFELDRFNIRADVILKSSWEDENILRRLIFYRLVPIKCFSNIRNKYFIDEPYYFFREKDSYNNFIKGGAYNKYNQQILNNNSKFIFLKGGYWQSENYFKDIFNEIKEELTLVDKKNVINNKIYQDILKLNSVCIGVRRFTDSENSKGYYKLNKNYYKNAINIIKNKVENPKFYIFSLEKQWCRDNLDLDSSVEIIKSGKSYEDLYLMSQCKNFIISNSTFHWWGAWLAEHSNKVVIAPSKGWGNECAVPDNWIMI